MAKGKILSELKQTAIDMIDNNGNFKTIPTGLTGQRNLPESRIMLLKDLLTLLKDSEIVCNETKLYIFNRYITLKGVNDVMNESFNKGDKPISYSTTTSKVNYDRSKLEKLFGYDLISDIVLRSNNEDKMKDYSNKIAFAYAKWGNKEGRKLRDNLVLSLNPAVLNTELDEDQFNELIATIEPYTRDKMQEVAKSLDEDCVGYFNYLLLCPLNNQTDKQRFEELKQILGTVKEDTNGNKKSSPTSQVENMEEVEN